MSCASLYIKWHWKGGINFWKMVTNWCLELYFEGFNKLSLIFFRDCVRERESTILSLHFSSCSFRFPVWTPIAEEERFSPRELRGSITWPHFFSGQQYICPPAFMGFCDHGTISPVTIDEIGGRTCVPEVEFTRVGLEWKYPASFIPSWERASC